MSSEDESDRLSDETGKRIIELQKTVGNKEVGRILNLEQEKEQEHSEKVEKSSEDDSISRRRNRFSGGSSLDGRGIRPSTVTPFKRIRKSNNRLDEFVDQVFAGRGKAKGVGALVKRYDMLDSYDFSRKLDLLVKIRLECERYRQLKGEAELDKGLESLYRQVCKEEMVIELLKSVGGLSAKDEKIKVLKEARGKLEEEGVEPELKEALRYLYDYIEKELNSLIENKFDSI